MKPLEKNPMASRCTNIENEQYFRGVKKLFIPKADKLICIIFMKIYIGNLPIIIV